MSGENTLSRRDWFRLRLHHAEAAVESARPGNPETRLVGTASAGLQPIVHPENHGEMNLADLPPMREGLLAEAQIRQLFSDIESQGSEILLMLRSVRSQRATASRLTATEQLRSALEALLSGQAPRVQIRYHWHHTDWIDTLQRRDDGVRLVRIAHRPAASMPPSKPQKPRS